MTLVVFTGLLYNLNTPIIRLYEGYPWEKSWLGECFVKQAKRRFEEIVLLQTSISYLDQALQDYHLMEKSLQRDLRKLGMLINTEFPDHKDFILPTRLGNVIRCFERYSTVAYGMDAIVLWPRLISKINIEFASTIDEAKASFDFMLNVSFLSSLSFLGIIAVGVSSNYPLTTASLLKWIWPAISFFALALIFYHFAIGRAKAWGMQIKAAFDLYRFDLLEALGYQQEPLTLCEEKALWERISAELLYVDVKKSNPVPYKDTV